MLVNYSTINKGIHYTQVFNYPILLSMAIKFMNLILQVYHNTNETRQGRWRKKHLCEKVNYNPCGKGKLQSYVKKKKFIITPTYLTWHTAAREAVKVQSWNLTLPPDRRHTYCCPGRLSGSPKSQGTSSPITAPVTHLQAPSVRFPPTHRNGEAVREK